MSQMLTKV